MPPRTVVTLPPQLPQAQALAFARRAKKRGAALLELRTDLHAPAALDAAELAQAIELLVAERGPAAPAAWRDAAALVDGEGGQIASLHPERPLSPGEALERWGHAPLEGRHLKHVEPLGTLAEAPRLFETQRRLRTLPAASVTVLATGPLSLPFRCVLAPGNGFDFVALDSGWSAAPGQRLAGDAVREQRAAGRHAGGRPRLGILGRGLEGSRSPRVHRQPFDRIDLPEDAPIGALVDALRPFYAGFAVTSPFKKRLAAHLGAGAEAINTLVRRAGGWEGANTDLEGARAVLARLDPAGGEVVALGDGGATAALRRAAGELGRSLRVLRRRELGPEPLGGRLVWTWPDGLPAPPELVFRDARVAVISYGAAGRRVAAEIARRGGEAVPLGAVWFGAQAAGQRAIWETAS
ncbi:MAG: shikimate dehydrogenase [Myxococcaceae bacterium]